MPIELKMIQKAILAHESRIVQARVVSLSSYSKGKEFATVKLLD
jgi:hypothetical protein